MLCNFNSVREKKKHDRDYYHVDLQPCELYDEKYRGLALVMKHELAFLFRFSELTFTLSLGKSAAPPIHTCCHQILTLISSSLPDLIAMQPLTPATIDNFNPYYSEPVSLALICICHACI